MATIDSSSGTSFSEIRNAYNSSEGRDALNDTILRSWTTSSPLSMSYFRGAKFTDGSIVPTSGPISMGDIFKVEATPAGAGKTFSGSEIISRTHNFYAYNQWSPYSARLFGTAGLSTYDEMTFDNKRISLTTTQSSSYPYTILLLSNKTSDTQGPGFYVRGSNKINRATVWLRRQMMSPASAIQMGIIKKDWNKTWTQQKSYIHTDSATGKDRIGIHNTGFITSAGSADSSNYVTSKIDPLTNSSYPSYVSSGMNLHTSHVGLTGGTLSSSYSGTYATAHIGNSYFFPPGANYYYYQNYFNNVDSYVGIDVEYVEVIIKCTVAAGSYPNLVFDEDQDLSEIYSGLYIEGVSVSIPNHVYIKDFNISQRLSYILAENQQGTTWASGVSPGTGKVRLYGYVLRFRYSDSYYIKDIQVGPEYIILPQYHIDNPSNYSSSYWKETHEWAFYVGDTTSGQNSFNIDIMDNAPIGKYYYINWGRSIANPPDTFWGTSHQWVTASSGSGGVVWDPSQSDGMQNWKNGTDAITTGQTYWNYLNQTVTDWNCVRGTLYHSTGTGPCNNVNGTVSDVGDSEGNKDIYRSYLYTEGTDYQKLFIFRTEKLNFHNLVSSYSNKLYLKFYIHAFGSDIGNLYIYISHLDKCTESTAYKLAEYGPNTAIPWSGFTASDSHWQEKIIDISRFSSRPIESTEGWYLYFVSCNATGQKSDVCIDQIQIVETGLFNKVYQFLDQTPQQSGGDWTPSLTGDIGQSGEAHQWANGGDAVSPWRDPPAPAAPATKYWYGTTPMKGWNLSNGATPSSNTGPDGPYLGNSGESEIGPHGTTTGYLYTEPVGVPCVHDFVVRLPGINFYREMLDPFSNHITFNFYVHAFGDSLIDRNLRIYIDSEPQSDHSSATLLRSIGGKGQAAWIDFTSSSDDWKKITTYLKDSSGNKYCSYTHNKTWYIYIVSGGTGLSSGNTAEHDLAIDYLYFQETSVAPPVELYSFESHIFTNAGATGRNGPTYAHCKSEYDATAQPLLPPNSDWWNYSSFFGVTNGIQKWTVPKTGTYTIIAEGGEGGRGYADNSTTSFKAGGLGAQILGVFTLTKDEIIHIVVGQKGHSKNDVDRDGNITGGVTNYYYASGGGGGGSFVVRSPYNTEGSILVIAGGGGGGGSRGRDEGGHALTAETGTNTGQGNSGEGGGPGGMGNYYYGHGGGGFNSEGEANVSGSSVDYFDDYPAESFKEGARGGKGEVWHAAAGGFGGGGGTGLSPGGGGGFSGGSGTGAWASSDRAYGGGSYNADTSSTSRAVAADPVAGSGHGSVTIIYGISDGGLSAELYPFTTHTFTNCGAKGRFGPSSSQCLSTYSSASWTANSSYFSTSYGLQKWTVPKSGNYSIAAYGAQGGDGWQTPPGPPSWPYDGPSPSPPEYGGYTLRNTGEFNLIKGDIIWICVGQKGSAYGDNLTNYTTYAHRPGAGGGGTFVVKASPDTATISDILVIAGGGGGAGQKNRGSDGGSATINTHDTSTPSASGAFATGAAGYGGDPSTGTYALGHSGAGFLSAGGYAGHPGYTPYLNMYPQPYVNSAAHSSPPPNPLYAWHRPLVGGKCSVWFQGEGGFGGGGGTGLGPGGGGGGYSGGDTYGTWSGSGRGYGGGSINNGLNSSYAINYTGHGKCIITLLS